MAQDDNMTDNFDLESRLPELQQGLELLEGQTGTKITTEFTNIGFGLATEYLKIRLGFTNGGGQERTVDYFVKRLIENKVERYIPFLQANKRTHQQTEFELLNMYRNLGCNVPSPAVKLKNILIMREIAGKSLEDLTGPEGSEEKRAELVEQTIPHIKKINDNGRRIEGYILHGNLDVGKKIEETANLLKQSERYFTILAATEEDLRGLKSKEEEAQLIEQITKKCGSNFSVFNSFFEIINRHFSSQNNQLIHGDMTSYHVIINENGEPWFIDFGKPKNSNVVFDTIPLYFSQDTSLSLKIVEELFRKELDIRGVSKDRIDEEFKSLYLGGCFSNIRRGSKNLTLRVACPNEYALFINKHPSYAYSLGYYKNTAKKLLEGMLKNKDRFKIDRQDYESIKNFLDLSDKFIPPSSYVDRCPISIKLPHTVKWDSLARAQRDAKPTKEHV